MAALFYFRRAQNSMIETERILPREFEAFDLEGMHALHSILLKLTQ